MSDKITIKSAKDCTFDCISLGEIMLRFDPGEERIHTTRKFKVWEGGGEYNVTRGLTKCFGLKTAVVTALADNAIGRLIEDCIMQGGVSTEYIQWRVADPIGKTMRNGLNFTERGFGIRRAVGIPDRGNTAASQLKAGDIDWDNLFGVKGARWFHTGGIFTALSETTPDLVIEAVKSAHKYGTIVSYDLNYRKSLWDSHGGKDKAAEINSEIVKYVDVLIGNEEDFGACLGFNINGNDAGFSKLDKQSYASMAEKVCLKYPNIRFLANTLRTVHSASVNDWDAILYSDGKLYSTKPYENLLILDRVGGGDSFAAGLVFGFLMGYQPELSLSYALAHGALAMTTPGDTSMATLSDVESLIRGEGARVVR